MRDRLIPGIAARAAIGALAPVGGVERLTTYGQPKALSDEDRIRITAAEERRKRRNAKRAKGFRGSDQRTGGNDAPHE